MDFFSSGSGTTTPDLSFGYDTSQRQSPVNDTINNFLPPLPSGVTRFPTTSFSLEPGTGLSVGMGTGTNLGIMGSPSLSAGLARDTGHPVDGSARAVEMALQQVQTESSTFRVHLLNICAETDNMRRELLHLRAEVRNVQKTAENVEARVDTLGNTVSDLCDTVAELDEQQISSIGPERNSKGLREKRNSKLEDLVHEKMQGMIGLPYKGRNARFDIPSEPPSGTALPIPGNELPDNYVWQPMWSKDAEFPYNNAFITMCTRLVRRDDSMKQSESTRRFTVPREGISGRSAPDGRGDIMLMLKRSTSAEAKQTPAGQVRGVKGAESLTKALPALRRRLEERLGEEHCRGLELVLEEDWMDTCLTKTDEGTDMEWNATKIAFGLSSAAKVLEARRPNWRSAQLTKLYILLKKERQQDSRYVTKPVVPAPASSRSDDPPRNISKLWLGCIYTDSVDDEAPDVHRRPPTSYSMALASTHPESPSFAYVPFHELDRRYFTAFNSDDDSEGRVPVRFYAIDDWLHNRGTVNVPDGHCGLMFVSPTNMIPDYVHCSVEMRHDDPADLRKAQLANDMEFYTLTLSIEIPETPIQHPLRVLLPQLQRAATPLLSFVPAHLRKSPPAILHTWSCHWGDDMEIRPMWTRRMYNRQTITFQESFAFISNLYTILATHETNISQGLSPAMLKWAWEVSPLRLARKLIRRSVSEVCAALSDASSTAWEPSVRRLRTDAFHSIKMWRELLHKRVPSSGCVRQRLYDSAIGAEPSPLLSYLQVMSPLPSQEILVPCDCPRCNGKCIPRSTRAGHQNRLYLQRLRDAQAQSSQPPPKRRRTVATSASLLRSRLTSGAASSTGTSIGSGAPTLPAAASGSRPTPSRSHFDGRTTYASTALGRTSFILSSQRSPTRLLAARPSAARPSPAARSPTAGPFPPSHHSTARLSPTRSPSPPFLSHPFWSPPFDDTPFSELMPLNGNVYPPVQTPAGSSAASTNFRGHEHEQSMAAAEQTSFGDDIGDADESEEEPDRVEHSSATSHPSGLFSAADVSADSVYPACDPRYPNENNPDPFLLPRAAAPRSAAITPATINPAFYIVYLTVAWLHTAFKLPFLACNALLRVFLLILAAVGAELGADARYQTLQSVLEHMGVEPSFRVLPVCPTCLEVHPDTLSDDATCSRCSEPLFRRTRRLPNRSSPDTRTDAGDAGPSRPFLQFPYHSIEAQLRDILAVPGIEEELEKWRDLPRQPGRYTDSFDGRVLREIRGPDNRPFFENPSPVCDDELRIGVTFGIDWFSYLRSQIAPSHSSCPMSFNIINLPPSLRYRVSNMILAGIMPGPKEQNGDQCDKTSPGAFDADGYPRRTHAEQVRLGQAYAHCSTDRARSDFVREHATRWCELARLPYFDLCTMIVIDPMHNLLLGAGLVKTHFYHLWIQGKVLRKTKELRCLHAVLRDLTIPSYVGRLPALMGEPGGGSLTADQWMIAATIICPIAIWDQYMEGDPEEIRSLRIGDIKAAQERRKAIKKKRAEEQARKGRGNRPQRNRKRTARSLWVDEDRDEDEEVFVDAGAQEQQTDLYGDDKDNEEGDTNRGPRLHPDDPGNFFKLSAALNLLLALTIDDASIDEAAALLRDYCIELIHLYGPDVIRPNHHYAMHIPECIRDFGPLHCFWTFLFERMNKVPKSYNSSNHSGDNRGTVQALARESDLRAEDDGIPLLSRATFFDYVIISQRRYWAAYRTNDHANSLVSVLMSDNCQAPLTPPNGLTLGWMRWLVPTRHRMAEGSSWHQISNGNMRVDLWEHSQFDGEINPIIPIENIQSHVVLATVTVSGEALWVTVPEQAHTGTSLLFCGTLLTLADDAEDAAHRRALTPDGRVSSGTQAPSGVQQACVVVGPARGDATSGGRVPSGVQTSAGDVPSDGRRACIVVGPRGRDIGRARRGDASSDGRARVVERALFVWVMYAFGDATSGGRVPSGVQTSAGTYRRMGVARASSLDRGDATSDGRVAGTHRRTGGRVSSSAHSSSGACTRFWTRHRMGPRRWTRRRRRSLARSARLAEASQGKAWARKATPGALAPIARRANGAAIGGIGTIAPVLVPAPVSPPAPVPPPAPDPPRTSPFVPRARGARLSTGAPAGVDTADTASSPSSSPGPDTGVTAAVPLSRPEPPSHALNRGVGRARRVFCTPESDTVLTNCVARPVTIGATVKKLLRYNYIIIGTILQIYGFDDFMAGFVVHVDAHALDLKCTADVYEDTLLALSGFQGYGTDARMRARTAGTDTIESLVNVARHLLDSRLWIDKPGQQTIPELFNWDHIAIYPVVPA
ncbi:hypothetical protein K488DRAFT_74674, partial [Vararia minispora EC-137]